MSKQSKMHVRACEISDETNHTTFARSKSFAKCTRLKKKVHKKMSPLSKFTNCMLALCTKKYNCYPLDEMLVQRKITSGWKEALWE